MLHIPFRQINQLKGECDSFTEVYAIFLQSGNVPSSLEEDIQRLTAAQQEEHDDSNEEVLNLHVHMYVTKLRYMHVHVLGNFNVYAKLHINNCMVVFCFFFQLG